MTIWTQRQAARSSFRADHHKYADLKAIKNIFLRYSRLRRMVKIVCSAERWKWNSEQLEQTKVKIQKPKRFTTYNATQRCWLPMMVVAEQNRGETLQVSERHCREWEWEILQVCEFVDIVPGIKWTHYVTQVSPIIFRNRYGDPYLISKAPLLRFLWWGWQSWSCRPDQWIQTGWIWYSDSLILSISYICKSSVRYIRMNT